MSTETPENAQNARGTRTKRNAVTFKPSKRSIPELISDPPNLSAITDEQSARTELESRLLMTRAAETTIESLTTALLDFSVQAPSLTPMHIDVIRAIAILLIKTDHNQKARNISSAVCSLLEDPINRLSKIAENNTNEDNSNHSLNEAIKKAEATVDEISGSLKTFKESIDQLTPTIRKIQDNATETANINSRLEKMQQEITNLFKTSPQNSGYKAALLTGLDIDTNDHSPRIAARDTIKARQILINVAPDGPVAPGKVSHAQLVEKIKASLSKLTADGTPELGIRSVTQYRNGGTILEMMTSEAAEYLKKNEIKEEFLKNLDPKASFKDRGYLVVIQFVPLTFNPSSDTQIQELEKENDWEQGTVTSARWIKPPNKRTNNQQVAHLLVVLKNPTSANEGIRNGIALKQNKLQAKKNRREPIRCAKCQHYGHIARECTSHCDTCANCAEDHRTSECNNHDRRCCIACETEGHASWERSCPEFERRCADLDKRYPENTMPYFPTNELWTQVAIPAKATTTKANRTNSPQQQQNHQPRTQDTLDKHMFPRGGRPSRGTSHLPRNAGFSSRRYDLLPPSSTFPTRSPSSDALSTSSINV